MGSHQLHQKPGQIKSKADSIADVLSMSGHKMAERIRGFLPESCMKIKKGFITSLKMLVFIIFRSHTKYLTGKKDIRHLIFLIFTLRARRRAPGPELPRVRSRQLRLHPLRLVGAKRKSRLLAGTLKLSGACKIQV